MRKKNITYDTLARSVSFHYKSFVLTRRRCEAVNNYWLACSLEHQCTVLTALVRFCPFPKTEGF